jgi:hypothetical protein
MTDSVFTGVWVSAEPLSPNEGAYGDVLLEIVELCEEDVAPFEWIEEGKGYREFLVPAALLNERGIVGVVDEEALEDSTEGDSSSRRGCRLTR